jgi:hypothetical protein
MATKLTKPDSQNSDTTAPNGRELYHLQFSFQVASPETFGYTLLLRGWAGYVARMPKTRERQRILVEEMEQSEFYKTVELKWILD